MPKRFARIDAVLRDAPCTAAVARIEHRGVCIFERAYGRTRADDRALPVYVDTRFDLASISKVFMAMLALRLVAAGALALDAPLVAHIPEWRNRPHEAITLRMLLAHTSGMYSGAEYRKLFNENVASFAFNRELLALPGERVIYSDLGFIVLGALLERVTQRALPALVRAHFPSATLGFCPLARERAGIPATEDDGWRGRVQGSVHDEKAQLMNGVAGHAGLFGTAADVAALTESFLAPTRGNDAITLLPRALACEAIREAAYDPVLRRGLGWALKTNDENSCGRSFSPESFGHTGFVGTCVWADPVRDVQAVLLTNTVYFGRADSRPLRAAFYEAVIEELPQ